MVDAELLDELDDATRAAIEGSDNEAAVAAILQEIEALPAFTALVRDRSRWLAAIQLRFAHWEESWEPALEPRLLLAIAQTALAAHETAAALTALSQAVELAEELECGVEEIKARALRLPWLPADQAQAEIVTLDERLLVHRDVGADAMAHVHLGRAAIYARSEAWDGVRVELAGVGRLALPRDERITWVAYTSQLLLVRMGLRTQQRAAAAQALMEAARIAAELGSHAELANLQALVAAFAVRTGSFEAAILHAGNAIDALAESSITQPQPDPWLGLPFDIAAERQVAGAIRATAESAIAAQEAGDRTAFLLAVTVLVALYLASDRAPEALDALNEAQQAAADLGDGAARALIRSISESLLRYMGMLA